MKNRDRNYDMGGGFWVEVRHHGSQVWYDAVQLDAEGYVVAGRKATFSYRRAADAQVAKWKVEGQPEIEPPSPELLARRETTERAVAQLRK